jgi:hypothetical protein
VLAVQDALRLTIFAIGLAIISVLFVRSSRKPQRIPEQTPSAGTPADAGEHASAEAALAG